ncbi:MAG: hypothetical protein ABID61_02325, partial [Candidatus Micrarchaeota archaeon]
NKQNKYWDMIGIHDPAQKKFLEENPELANKLWAWHTGVEYGRERTEKDVTTSTIFSPGIPNAHWWGKDKQNQPVYQRFVTRKVWDPNDPTRLVLNTTDKLKETGTVKVQVAEGTKMANAPVFGWNDKGEQGEIGRTIVPIKTMETIARVPRYYTTNEKGKLQEGPLEDVIVKPGQSVKYVNILKQDKTGKLVKTRQRPYTFKQTTTWATVSKYERTTPMGTLVAELMTIQAAGKQIQVGDGFDRWLTKEGYKRGFTIEEVRLAIMQQYGVQNPKSIDFLLATPEARGILGTLMQGNYRLTGNHSEKIIVLMEQELARETTRVQTAIRERTAKITVEKEEAAQALAAQKKRRRTTPVVEAKTTTEQTPEPVFSWGNVGKRVIDLTVSAEWARKLPAKDILKLERTELMKKLGLTSDQQATYEHLFKFPEIRQFFEDVQSGKLEKTTGRVLDKGKIVKVLQSINMYMDVGDGRTAKETVDAHGPDGKRTQVLQRMGVKWYFKAKILPPTIPSGWKPGLESYYDGNKDLQRIFKDRQKFMDACVKVLSATYGRNVPEKPAEQTDVFITGGTAAQNYQNENPRPKAPAKKSKRRKRR